jgi:hypothetical protein
VSDAARKPSDAEFDRLIIEAHRGMSHAEIRALDALEGKLRAAWERREEQKRLDAKRSAA